MVFSFLNRWNRKRILRRHRISNALWRSVIRQVRAAAHLTAVDIERLHDTASLFLYEKSIEPAHGLDITDAMRARIGCEAAIPILNLGLDYYHHWHAVIVYPATFVAR